MASSTYTETMKRATASHERIAKLGDDVQRGRATDDEARRVATLARRTERRLVNDLARRDARIAELEAELAQAREEAATTWAREEAAALADQRIEALERQLAANGAQGGQAS